MNWSLSHRFDRRALPLADRHYNRQKPGTPQFATPGRTLVLLTPEANAVWVTSWPEYAQHAWRGAWVNTLFRNESGILSSTLIAEAVQATRWRYGQPPARGYPMVTFINPAAVRAKRHPGYCYLMAGWEQIGLTSKRGYHVLGLPAHKIPFPAAPAGAQFELV